MRGFCSYGFLVAGLFCGNSVVRAAMPVPDHVVIVIEENHSQQDIIGNTDAPYMNSLANSGANFTNFFALTHPSQPNYLELFSGSSQGVTNDTVPPAGAPYSTANLGAALIAAGKTFVGYSETLPGEGSTAGSSGAYQRKHNPWVDWQVADAPLNNHLPVTTNEPFTAFPSDYSLLPKVSIVVPNQDNDMHDGTIAQADTWLSNNLGAYNTWAQTHNSLLIVTWDEDDRGQHNKIPTIFSGPMVRNVQNNQAYTLHSLLRTVSDMYGAAPTGKAASVAPISGIWTTEPPIATSTFRRGTNSYSGAQDTYLDTSNPNSNLGASTSVVCDNSPVTQGLVKFTSLFTSQGGSIPDGATITTATLTITTGPSSGTSDNSTNTMELHRMLIPWTESSTYNSLNSGVSLNDVEAKSAAGGTIIPGQLDASINFDVTATLQNWANGQENDGWALINLGSDEWRWVSSESTDETVRPMLTVSFVVPEPAGLMLLGTGLMALSRRRQRPLISTAA